MFLIKRHNYLNNNLLINLSEIQITDKLKKFKFDNISFVDFIININEKENDINNLVSLLNSTNVNEIKYSILTLCEIFSIKIESFENNEVIIENFINITNKNKVIKYLSNLLSNSIVTTDIRILYYITWILINITYYYIQKEDISEIINEFDLIVDSYLIYLQNLKVAFNIEIKISIINLLVHLTFQISPINSKLLNNIFFINSFLFQELSQCKNKEYQKELLKLVVNLSKEKNYKEIIDKFLEIYKKVIQTNNLSDDVLNIVLYGINNIVQIENYSKVLFYKLEKENFWFFQKIINFPYQDINKEILIPILNIIFTFLSVGDEKINNFFIQSKLFDYLEEIFRFNEFQLNILNCIKIFCIGTIGEILYIINHSIFQKVISSMNIDKIELKIESCQIICNCLYYQSEEIADELLKIFQNLFDCLLNNLTNYENKNELIILTLEIILRLILLSKDFIEIVLGSNIIEILEKYNIINNNKEIQTLSNGILRRITC